MFVGSGSCPECGIALRRNNFRIQLFEDALIDKEVDIRKRILRDFNKKEEDFSTLKVHDRAGKLVVKNPYDCFLVTLITGVQ